MFILDNTKFYHQAVSQQDDYLYRDSWETVQIISQLDRIQAFLPRISTLPVLTSR